MRYSIESILKLASDLQSFPHHRDDLDNLLDAYSSDELAINELEMVAAAREEICPLTFDEFTEYVKKTKPH